MRTLPDLGELNDKRVLVRVDFNVPIADGKVSDDTRIRATLPTLQELRRRGGKLILVSHLGRPKEREPEFSLRQVVGPLTELAGGVVRMAPAVVGDEVTEMADSLAAGDIMLLENVRYEPGETKNDPQLAASLAALADVYVDDAFGAAHRAHASTVGVAELLAEHAAGLLLEKEVRVLRELLEDPDSPARRRPGRRQGERQDQGDRALPRGGGHDPDRWRDGVPVPGGPWPRRRRLTL